MYISAGPFKCNTKVRSQNVQYSIYDQDQLADDLYGNWSGGIHAVVSTEKHSNDIITIKIFNFKKGNRDRKDISYLKIKKVHKQEGWIGLLKVKKVWKQEG